MPMYSYSCTHCIQRIDVLRSFDQSSEGPTIEEVAQLKLPEGAESVMCPAVGGHDWRRHYSPVVVSKWPNSTGPVKGRG